MIPNLLYLPPEWGPIFGKILLIGVKAVLGWGVTHLVRSYA